MGLSFLIMSVIVLVDSIHKLAEVIREFPEIVIRESYAIHEIPADVPQTFEKIYVLRGLVYKDDKPIFFYAKGQTAIWVERGWSYAAEKDLRSGHQCIDSRPRRTV